MVSVLNATELFTLKWLMLALTSVAQLVGRCPTKPKAADSFPGQGTCGFSLQLGTDRCFSFSLSPSFPLSLKINE